MISRRPEADMGNCAVISVLTLAISIAIAATDRTRAQEQGSTAPGNGTYRGVTARPIQTVPFLHGTGAVATTILPDATGPIEPPRSIRTVRVRAVAPTERSPDSSSDRK
jgi:hypothetical protein